MICIYSLQHNGKRLMAGSSKFIPIPANWNVWMYQTSFWELDSTRVFLKHKNNEYFDFFPPFFPCILSTLMQVNMPLPREGITILWFSAEQVLSFLLLREKRHFQHKETGNEQAFLGGQDELMEPVQQLHSKNFWENLPKPSAGGDTWGDFSAHEKETPKKEEHGNPTCGCSRWDFNPGGTKSASAAWLGRTNSRGMEVQSQKS